MTLAERLKQEGIQQGIQQGIQKGRMEEKLDIARQLQKTGMSFAQICQITGLSEAELKKNRPLSKHHSPAKCRAFLSAGAEQTA